MRRHDVARMIDVSAVQAFHTEDALRKLVDVAQANDFIAVHSLPCWTRLLSQLLVHRPDIMVGAPVGFPSGGSRTETKIVEARHLADDGVDEMDVMMNIGKLKSGDDNYVKDELLAVIEEVSGIPVKVIIETPHLTADEIDRASAIVRDSGAAFIKTGTGWTGRSADLDTIRRIVSVAGGKVEVKAAGGIRTLSALSQMHALGVRRFGINADAATSILAECEQAG